MLLSACASHQTLAPYSADVVPALWSRHHQQMLDLSHWQVKGKIGYKNTTEAGSAWVDWTQQAQQFTLHLSGPFGAGSMQIMGDHGLLTLRQADGADISLNSAAAITSEQLLFDDLPFEELSYWIRGIPSPNAEASQLSYNQQSLLTVLHQSGWQLLFSKYRQTSAGTLPGKIIATQGKVRFKLIIKEHLFDNQMTSH